jgi:hypothetical protein
MLRRLAQLSLPLATALLAVLTTAWAATGRLPLTAVDPARALVVPAQATGPLVAGDADGRAILTASAMAPGSSIAGSVTIRNAGDASGVFTLSAADRVDAGGPGAAAGLSTVLELSVLDTTAGRPVTVYDGTLAAFSRAALGTFPAGGFRVYRFVVSYPTGRPALADDPYQGASTSVAFVWDAAGTGQAGEPVPAPAPSGGGSGATGGVAAGGTAVGGPAAGAAQVPGLGSAAPALGRLRIGLGVRSRRVVRGRITTRMWSSAPSRARVHGTVTVGRRRMKLRAVTVRLTAKRRTVPVRLPKAALAAGRPKRLTVRLVVTASAGARKATLRRTVRARR